MKSPIKCEVCNGTYLEPMADVVWSETQGQWVAQWVNLDEGYCFDCGEQRQFVKNGTSKRYVIHANERWEFEVVANSLEEAYKKVEEDPFKYRGDFRYMNEFEVVDTEEVKHES